jgi:hypothetical protein
LILPREHIHVVTCYLFRLNAVTFAGSGIALPALRSVKFLDRLRERFALMHDSRRTEEIYVYGCRTLIRFHTLRHPAEIGRE